jgi:dextranase
MKIFDLYPTRGFFKPGQPATLALELELEADRRIDIRLQIHHLADEPFDVVQSLDLQVGRRSVILNIPADRISPGGYGVRLTVRAQAGLEPIEAWTAFDCLTDWTVFPRYGFLCDFGPQTGADAAMDQLVRYHINGLQFYDWQYRHDQLLAPSQEYLDPLNRPLSLRTIRQRIDAAHAYGMAAMPYLAVYAASAEFWRAHPEWALYDSRGQAIPFGEDFLGLMDPTAGRPWAEHLLAESGRALAGLDWDGLHVDQYGEPKQAWDAAGRAVDLPAAFADFVRAGRERFPGKTIIFNAVGNWPIEALTGSPAGFEYIEVWPPDNGFGDLLRIVRQARKLSADRPAVIAVYIPNDRPANILLADALIFASGGARIELGEAGRLLADPYFPKHQPLDAELQTRLRGLYDFAVRYGEWIGPGAAEAIELNVQVGGPAWTTVRSAPGWRVVNLINRNGLGDRPEWDIPQPFPEPMTGLEVEIVLPEKPGRVLWASPDDSNGSLRPLEFVWQAGRLRVEAPRLDLWAFLAIETRPVNGGGV